MLTDVSYFNDIPQKKLNTFFFKKLYNIQFRIVSNLWGFSHILFYFSFILHLNALDIKT